MKDDGTLWGWGNNTAGQLGTGNANSASTPVQSIWSFRRPSCTISSPLWGATYHAPARISIQTETEGAIKVEFWNGNTKLYEDATTPYAFEWTNVPAGQYTLTARAVNKLGQVTTSEPVVVIVNALSGSFGTAPASLNLTSEGTVDWIHAGHRSQTAVPYDATAGITRKNVATPRITEFSSHAARRDTNAGLPRTWTDGTPSVSASVTNTTTAVALDAPEPGSGFSFTVAGTAGVTRTLRVYLKNVNSDTQLLATIGNSKYTATWNSTSTTAAYRVYTITFTAGGPNQYVNFLYGMNPAVPRTGANIWFLGATLR